MAKKNAEKKAGKAQEKQAPVNLTLTKNQLMERYNKDRAVMARLEEKRATFYGLFNEMGATIESLEALGKAKKGDKFLADLGSGVFIEAVFGETGKVKESLAGNFMLDGSKDKALKSMKEKRAELEKGLEKLSVDEQRVAANLASMEGLLRKFDAQEKKLIREQLLSSQKKK